MLRMLLGLMVRLCTLSPLPFPRTQKNLTPLSFPSLTFIIITYP